MILQDGKRLQPAEQGRAVGRHVSGILVVGSPSSSPPSPDEVELSASEDSQSLGLSSSVPVVHICSSLILSSTAPAGGSAAPSAPWESMVDLTCGVLSLIGRSAVWILRESERRSIWFSTREAPESNHAVTRPMLRAVSQLMSISSQAIHRITANTKQILSQWTFPINCSTLQRLRVAQQRLAQPQLPLPAQRLAAAASSPSPNFSPVPPRPRSFGSVNSIPSHESVPFWNSWSRALIPPRHHRHPHRHLLHHQSAFTLSVSTLASR